MVKEDYAEQFCAKTPEEVQEKVAAAVARAKALGMTFPQLTIFPEHRTEEHGDVLVFQAWRVAPKCGEAAPAEPMVARA